MYFSFCLQEICAEWKRRRIVLKPHKWIPTKPSTVRRWNPSYVGKDAEWTFGNFDYVWGYWGSRWTLISMTDYPAHPSSSTESSPSTHLEKIKVWNNRGPRRSVMASKVRHPARRLKLGFWADFSNRFPSFVRTLLL